jgi:type I restriction enzyme S subunit
MKQGWEKRNLGEVVEVLDNLRKPITKRDRVEGDYPYYGATGILSYVHNFIFSEKLVLIGEDGAKWLSGDNTSFIAEGKYWVNNHAHVIRPIRKLILDEWIVYFLNFSDLTPFITGMTVPKLNQEKMRSIPIPLPPLLEQQRIVSILDETFAAMAKAKANAEQNLKNAKELFESYLQGVFENGNWETKELGEICEISSKLIDPRKPEFQNLIHIGAGNIESKKGTLLDLKTAKEENLISGKFLFDESMILYSKIRPYLMKVVNCEFKGLCSADIYPLVPIKGKITKEYLYHLLLTKDFTDYAILGSQRAGMPKVNREHLFAYKLQLPSINEQQIIVQKLDALLTETNKLEAIYQQKVNDLEELKKGVLQKAFAGELNVGAPLVGAQNNNE